MQTIALLMGMNERVWARHASPWSVWTRVATFPLLVAAVWSRAWIGWWALLPVALLLIWTWLNPRVFPPPRRTDTWASKATFGERIWLNRRRTPPPPHHRRAVHALLAITTGGTLLLAWGLLTLGPTLTLSGLAIAMLGKLWFCDRMVWLYDEMRDTADEYRSWLKA